MAKIERFEDLRIWQEARKICQFIDVLLRDTKLKTHYSLADQMDRSSGSVMDNIAEGFDREGNKEFIHFLSIAKGSCAETKSQSYRALDKRLISTEQHQKLYDMLEAEINQIGGMMSYLSKSDYKGTKFKKFTDHKR